MKSWFSVCSLMALPVVWSSANKEPVSVAPVRLLISKVPIVGTGVAFCEVFEESERGGGNVLIVSSACR